MSNASEISPSKSSDVFVFDADEPWQDAGPGVRRKILGHDGALMAAERSGSVPATATSCPPTRSTAPSASKPAN